jgi:PAS domain S-box-containing protein
LEEWSAPEINQWKERLHPEDRARVLAADESSKATGESFGEEYRLIAKDGSVVWVRDQATLLRNASGEPWLWQGVLLDVTDRKHAERKLQETEQRYRSLVERVPAVVYVQEIGSPESAMYMSPQIEALTGYSPEECKNPDLRWGMVHPDDRERMQSEDERLGEAEAGEVFSTEYRLVHRDGRTKWVSSESIMIEDEVSGTRYWQGCMFDITERKQAEEELRETNRRLRELAVLKADFTAMVAHEIDTPLAVIRGYAELLATGELEPAEQARALDKIQSETEILNTLVGDVRVAASVERENFTVEPQPVPVRALLDTAVQRGAPLLGNHPLVTENAADDEQVWADQNRISQVLRNLISNAVRYSSDSAPIELRAKPDKTPGRVRIEVADRGPGIHPDDVQRVFEKFGRGRDRHGRKVPGTGLGLYLSRRIVQAHGSDLTLSSGPKDGSVFGFELEVVR